MESAEPKLRSPTKFKEKEWDRAIGAMIPKNREVRKCKKR